MTAAPARPATLAGPLPGLSATAGTSFDLGAHGYVAEEFFFSGTATSYAPSGQCTDDGRWDVAPDAEAAFTSRALVHRPVDPAHFSGCVVVEWLNVTGGLDGAPDWLFLHRHLMRSGVAWIGVSAQEVGIQGGGAMPSNHLKKADPERYGALHHPGDRFAYDIFSQLGRLVRQPGPGLLGPLTAEVVLAVGESQSATYLLTYVNAVDRLAAVYDGFLLHGRGASGAPLEGGFMLAADPDLETRAAALQEGRQRIREDVRVPVLTVQSETDVVALGGGRGRQQDGPRFRLWEIAGAAHFDTYGLSAAFVDDGSLSGERLVELLTPSPTMMGFTGGGLFNSGPQQHYVAQAAFSHLERWVRGGEAPPSAAPLTGVDADATALVVDDQGIATGGVRTPWVDAPVAVLSGAAAPAANPIVFLFGTTAPLPTGRLSQLYPDGQADYEARFTEALDSAIQGGFLLLEDRAEILSLVPPLWAAASSSA